MAKKPYSAAVQGSHGDRSVSSGSTFSLKSQRVCYVKNPNPVFVPPKHHKPRPQLLRKAANFVNNRRVASWEGFPLLRPLADRQRRFNEHRARALQAVVAALIHHVDLVSWLVESSCEGMADLCGLSTVSDAGNKSITRFTRAIDDLEEHGIVTCEKIWDRVMGCWIPKMITVTELFWRMIGISPEEALAAQQQQLGYRKKGLTLSEQEMLTVTEAKRRAKQRFKEIAFERRRKKHHVRRAVRKSQELDALPWDLRRDKVASDLVRSMTPEECAALDLDGWRRMIDQEINRLRRYHSGDPPPTH